ncbi:MAG TPA: cytochrome c [Rhizomicrobium sp.]|nr:cytochrome c [Rhizomicrobium sp.]
MHRSLPAAGLLLPIVLLLSPLTAAAQTPPPPAADTGSKLPPGEGRELVMRVCGKCHTPDIVADQSLDGPGWKELVDQMAANGAQASDAEFDQIVAYLTKAFPAN